MASTVTLDDLVTRILERSGFEQSAPGFTSPAEQARLVNSLYKRLYNKLVDARGSEYYALKATFSTAAGTSVYPLETATGSGGCGMPRFMELLSIHVNADSTIRRVRQWEYAELDALLRLDQFGSGGSSVLRYRVTDVNLELLPTPNGVWTVYLRYVPTALTLVSGTATAGTESLTLDGVNGFDEWIVLSGAASIREKAEMDTVTLLNERALLDREIDEIKSKRNAADAPRIVSRGNPWSLNNFPEPHGFVDTDDV